MNPECRCRLASPQRIDLAATASLHLLPCQELKISAAVYDSSVSDAQIEAELKKCRLLCVPCHKQVRCDLLYNTPVHAPYRGAFSCSSLRSRSQPPVQPNQETLREKGREHDLKVRDVEWCSGE